MKNITFAALVPLAFLVGCASSNDSSLAANQSPTGNSSSENMPSYGPALKGYCVVSLEEIITTSKAGQSARQQIKEMMQADNHRVSSERDSLIASEKDLTSPKAKKSGAQYQKNLSDFEHRSAQFNQDIKTNSAQLQQLLIKTEEKITTSIRPALSNAVREHACSIVFDRKQIYGVNPSMDLTKEVLQAVDAALPPFKLSDASGWGSR